MKKIIALVLSLMMLVTSSISVMALGYGEEWNNYSDNNSQVYRDVTPAHWAFDAINRVSATQWFSGYPDGTFRPDASITREEAMKVIVTFLGLGLQTTTTSSYYDVDANRWSSPYIEAGKLLFPKIERFNGQVPFQPDAPMKREDVMYALIIAKKYNNEVTIVDQSILNMFTDANSISANVKPYVAKAVEIGLVAGKGSSIGAQDPLTRAEFATLLYRATYIGDGTGGGLSSMTELTSVELDNAIISELNIGDTLEIKATATLSNGTRVDYTDSLNPYNSSNNNVVLMNRNVVTAVSAGSALIKFNGDPMLADKHLVINVKAPVVEATPTPTPTPTPTMLPVVEDEEDDEDDRRQPTRVEDDEEEVAATLTKLEWSVASLDLNKGDTTKIKVTGTYSDGTTKDVTRDYTLYSTDEDVVEVGSNGKLTAVGVGEATINLTSNSTSLSAVSLPRPLTVVVRGQERNEIEALEWSTDDITIEVGETATVKLYAVYTDGTKEDVTEDCVVYSMKENVATVDGNEIEGISAGKTSLWFESMPAVGISLPMMLNVTVN